MDLTHSVLHALRTPDYVFEHDHYLPVHVARIKRLRNDHQQALDNPADNNVVEHDNASLWRVDGSTICGTRFFASPLASSSTVLIPLRIDVYIPDQSEHPARYREMLGSNLAVASRDMRLISSLGISKYIVNVLNHYSRSNPEWVRRYWEMPFASEIVFENISFPDVAKTRLDLRPSYDFERRTLSIQALRKKWSDHVKAEGWPPTVELSSLRLLKQLHDSISLVNVLNRQDVADGVKPFIFKSATDDLAFLYHELRLLLTLPPCLHIMPRPVAIVTRRSSFGGKQGAVGFLLQYFPRGSITDPIPRMVRDGSVKPCEQLKWSQQVLCALVHVVEKGRTFYSDLRFDNVLFCNLDGISPPDGHNPNEFVNVLLCDFEQRGSWHEWSAPEILFAQYVQSIQKHKTSRDPYSPYRDLLEAYYPSTPSSSSHLFGDQMEAEVKLKNNPWQRLSLKSAEKAMTYQFGLFLYCMFEGVSNPKRNISNVFPSELDSLQHSLEDEVEFPSFKRTPPVMQRLINDCTAGAPEWLHSDEDQSEHTKEQETARLQRGAVARRVIRKRFNLYPEPLDPAGHVEDQVKGMSQTEIDTLVLQTGYGFWRSELERARAFLKTDEWKKQEFGTARLSLREVEARLESIGLDWNCV